MREYVVPKVVGTNEPICKCMTMPAKWQIEEMSLVAGEFTTLVACSHCKQEYELHGSSAKLAETMKF